MRSGVDLSRGEGSTVGAQTDFCASPAGGAEEKGGRALSGEKGGSRGARALGFGGIQRERF